MPFYCGRFGETRSGYLPGFPPRELRFNLPDCFFGLHVSHHCQNGVVGHIVFLVEVDDIVADDSSYALFGPFGGLAVGVVAEKELFEFVICHALRIPFLFLYPPEGLIPESVYLIFLEGRVEDYI